MWLPRKEGRDTYLCHRRWSRKHGEQPQTRHSFTRSFHSFKTYAPDEHVAGPSLRSSQLRVCTNTQSHCYSCIFPAPHSKVHTAKSTQQRAQHQQDTHSAHTTAHDVTQPVHVASFLPFFFLLLPVSSSCFQGSKPIWFLNPKKVRRSINRHSLIGLVINSSVQL